MWQIQIKLHIRYTAQEKRTKQTNKKMKQKKNETKKNETKKKKKIKQDRPHLPGIWNIYDETCKKRSIYQAEKVKE